MANNTQTPAGSDSEIQSPSSAHEKSHDEHDHDIKYKTCSWQKTAALMFSEYITLSILSFPWAFSILGLVPAILLTIVLAATCLYTSITLWKYCLLHPDIRDVCDIGQKLFWDSTLAYRITAASFILHNLFIQGFHVLVGTQLLDTLSGSSQCSVVYGAITAGVCFFISLPRTLDQLSGLGMVSAICMGISILLAIIFSAVEGRPAGYVPGVDPVVSVFPASTQTFVSGMSAFMNMVYIFIGQTSLPSFIAEMENPRDFPKALWAVTGAMVVMFSLCGALMYIWIGNQYIVSPAFFSLTPTFRKLAFSFAAINILFLGSLFSSVSSRFIFFRIFEDSHHKHSHTLLGWSVWIGLVGLSWASGFVIAEVIPFFSDMLSLVASLFDGWFGFIFWAMAYLHMHPGHTKWATSRNSMETLVNYGFIALGFFILFAGTYVSSPRTFSSTASRHCQVSIQSILDSYKSQELTRPFTCQQ
ncbi:hypothetical protein BS17DRAFT_791721 [Gyrodon lividus]|nr:hypothetical protein BS17DRAFT_791721 [Gyrodon lividus]